MADFGGEIVAEFKEVINQWMRRCEACDKHENVECNIDGYVCDEFYKMRKYINPELVEQDVMSWAAENPKPVYPTWWEWLESIGIASKVKSDSIMFHDATKMYDPIPANIAQKLGLQPKEE